MGPHALVYPFAFVLSVFGGVPFVQHVLSHFRLSVQNGGLERAGTFIGIFERAMVTVLVFVSAYDAIGIVLAAKSIARFGQLRDRKFAEYYLIGTLASMSFALVLGVVANATVNLTGR